MPSQTTARITGRDGKSYPRTWDRWDEVRELAPTHSASEVHEQLGYPGTVKALMNRAAA